GLNTVRGPDVDTTWAISDRAVPQPDRMTPSGSTPRKITAVSAADNALTLAAGPAEFQTGDAVFYGAGDPANPVGMLTDGRAYFVIEVDAPHVKPAASLAAALAGTSPPLGPSTGPGQLDVDPPNVLTPTTALANIQGVLGGSGADTFIERLLKPAGQAPLA